MTSKDSQTREYYIAWRDNSLSGDYLVRQRRRLLWDKTLFSASIFVYGPEKAEQMVKNYLGMIKL